MELPFDCGCENRKEIMGAENWQTDAGIAAVVIVIAVVVFVLTKK